MPYAVTLRLDAAAARPIEAMWRALAEAGLHEDALRLGYPPHVTLTIHPDGVDTQALRRDVARLAAAWAAVPLRFSGLGTFVAPEPVLWLAPVVTETLLAHHRSLSGALADLPCDPHYRPGAWVPHVTLAKGGAAGDPGWMGRAFDCLAPLWPGVVPARADCLDLVRFRPVAVLACHPLPAGLAHAAAGV
ncbi:2'-5' RNA ligase family protein [Roseomonas eburnea]|uniref:2'-5' RNA ligase family protein n=1 Tax=Neoroseomonas eburnea TaxID=1346889 RepID=A0A9X9X783_9PROT|nr:2'-5' RNA ligase family protein [Neoroseomonas eburnea]MBR0679569.1 2'-5' RNA ligase family protein [Neoroseomonas eburnea]